MDYDEEIVGALVVDNGSGMCKGKLYEQQKTAWFCEKDFGPLQGWAPLLPINHFTIFC